MALKLKCPCGERLVAPESAIGKRAKCSKCGRKFVIPDPNASRSKVATPHSSLSSKSKSANSQTAAKPKVAAKAAGPDIPDLPDLGSGLGDFGSELPDLEGGLAAGGGLSSDMDSELDDFLNEETSNPFQSPTTSATPEPAPVKKGGGGGGSTPGQRNTLANGIKLVFWGVLLAVFGGLLGSFGGRMVAELALAGSGVQLIGYVLSTIGRVVCLGGPKNTGGRGLLIGAVVCDLSSIALMVLALVGAIPPELILVSGLLSLATPILFILYLKAVATWMRQPHLAEDAKMIIILIVVSIGLLIAAIPVAVFAPLLTLVMVLGFFGTVLFGLVKYVNLLQHTAEAVRP